MDKDTFGIRLISASKLAYQLASQYTKNEIIDNFIYTIIPNSLDLSDHLTESEKENLNERINELNKVFSANEVIDRLMIGDKVPLWINCSVIRSNKRETTIELLTSRRFRTDTELLHQNENYPPFHSLIQLPPYIFPYSNEKFDINWRFNKIQTTIKLIKTKIKIKKEIKQIQKLKTNYELSYEKLCNNLTERGRIDIVEKLKNGKSHLNGLTDGWGQFRNELDFIKRYYKLDLTKSELINLEYLLKEANKILKRKR